MSSIVLGVALMASSLLFGAPFWFAGCLLLVVGLGFFSSRHS